MPHTNRLLGLISDVHGDLPSLEDALTQLDRLGVVEVVCAGDLLDWGPSPARCVALLASRGIRCVRGNHDFVDHQGRAADGVVLDASSVAYIDAMPLHLLLERSAVRVVVAHARHGDVMAGIHAGDGTGDGTDGLLATAGADVLVVGHTHVPMHLTAADGAIVNPGSILRAAPGALPASGTFGVLELPSRRFTVRRTIDGADVRVRMNR